MHAGNSEKCHGTQERQLQPQLRGTARGCDRECHQKGYSLPTWLRYSRCRRNILNLKPLNGDGVLGTLLEILFATEDAVPLSKNERTIQTLSPASAGDLPNKMHLINANAQQVQVQTMRMNKGEWRPY